MKNVLLTILLCAVALTAAAQPALSPITAKVTGLKGRVKMVSTAMLFIFGDEGYGISTVTTSLYDTDGRLTDETEQSADGLDGDRSYRYDTQGRIASVRFAGGDGGRNEIYRYATDGRLLGVEAVDHQDGERRGYIVTEYDAHGRPAAMSDTTYGITYTFTYTAQGTLATSTMTRFDKPTVTYYGTNGKDSVMYNGRRTAVFQYNNRGDLVSMQRLVTCTYTYDDTFRDCYGNWLWRKITYNDGTEFFEDRTIIYYE